MTGPIHALSVFLASLPALLVLSVAVAVSDDDDIAGQRAALAFVAVCGLLAIALLGVI